VCRTGSLKTVRLLDCFGTKEGFRSREPLVGWERFRSPWGGDGSARSVVQRGSWAADCGRRVGDEGGTSWLLSQKTCGLLDFGLVVPEPGKPKRRRMDSESVPV
jgi:hypothetical protein